MKIIHISSNMRKINRLLEGKDNFQLINPEIKSLFIMQTVLFRTQLVWSDKNMKMLKSSISQPLSPPLKGIFGSKFFFLITTWTNDCTKPPQHLHLTFTTNRKLPAKLSNRINVFTFPLVSILDAQPYGNTRLLSAKKFRNLMKSLLFLYWWYSDRSLLTSEIMCFRLWFLV